MKTIKAIKEEIADVKYKLEHEEMKPAVEKRLRKRIPFLKMCIAYLESNPAREFIISELKKIDERIVRRMNLFVIKDEEKLTKKEVSKLRKTHEKLHEIKHLRDQLKTLRFLAA